MMGILLAKEESPEPISAPNPDLLRITCHFEAQLHIAFGRLRIV
jgi:hypothetical protein